MRKDLKKITKKILVENKETRTDDYILIAKVLERYFEKWNLDFKKYNFGEIVALHKSLALPSFESITRCRRTIQKECPELIDWRTQEIRELEEEKYLDLSRKGEI